MTVYCNRMAWCISMDRTHMLVALGLVVQLQIAIEGTGKMDFPQTTGD